MRWGSRNGSSSSRKPLDSRSRGRYLKFLLLKERLADVKTRTFRVALVTAPFMVLVGAWSGPAGAAASWYCRDEASSRRGNEIVSCGVGEGATEGDARAEALRYAYEELEAVCGISDDCASFQLNVAPLRTECAETASGYRCYRGLKALITGRKLDGAGRRRAFAASADRDPGESARNAVGSSSTLSRQLDDFQRAADITREIEREMLRRFDRQNP